MRAVISMAGITSKVYKELLASWLPATFQLTFDFGDHV